MRDVGNLHEDVWSQWHVRLPGQVHGKPVPHSRLAGKHHGRLVSVLDVYATLSTVKRPLPPPDPPVCSVKYIPISQKQYIGFVVLGARFLCLRCTD